MARNMSMTVVIATRNRCERLLATLVQLKALPDAPDVVVVDNSSDDDTVAAVQARHCGGGVEVIALPENRGAAARTAGVQAAATPYVAFCDDDSWWAPGALTAATTHFDRYPRLGLLAAKILVGEDERLDPLSAEMAASPLDCQRSLPGPAILGFAACGAVVRRTAYLHTGGFSPILFFLGEERLLAQDLAAAGWDLAYAPDVVAHHHPVNGHTSHSPEIQARQAALLRNDLLSDWMRRPVGVALRASTRLVGRAVRDRTARTALAGAVRRGPAALAHRRRLPADVERQIRLIS